MILNSNDIRNVRPIAENINDPARLEPYIREAETLRLMDAIGAKLYRWLDETDFSGPGPFQYGDVIITKNQVTKSRVPIREDRYYDETDFPDPEPFQPGDEPITEDQVLVTEDQGTFTEEQGPFTEDQGTFTEDRVLVTEEQGTFTKSQGAFTKSQVTITKDQYIAIMEGGYYDGGRSEGLKTAIAYIAYSRFIVNNPINTTAFGVRYKDGEFSTRVEDNIIIRSSNEARNIGEAYLEKAINHLKALQLLPPCTEYRESPARKIIIGCNKL